MAYLLKQYDHDLLCFDMEDRFDGLSVHILSISPEHKHLLPLDLTQTDGGLLKWLKRRTIPSNRAYVHNFLAKLGLNEKNTKGIIDISMGLSLNDCYWIVPEGFAGSFAEHNLYQNPFSRTLGLIAFTGYGSYQRSSFLSSPEFTTNGMLAKCWRRMDGKVLLYKSGTEGFANSGKEPYSEYYACQIAQAMEIPAVQYNLSLWKGRLCSTCQLFTDIEHGYVPVGNLVHEGGIRAVMDYYQKLGEPFYNALIDMLVFDAVICNTDRHFGNFGMMVEHQTNRIIGPAPVFDNGLSLFCYAMQDDLDNLDQFAQTCQPAAYPDHIAFAKKVMGKRQRDKLRKLSGFRFQRHPRYNLDAPRLQAIESFVNRRVQALLDC